MPSDYVYSVVGIPSSEIRLWPFQRGSEQEAAILGSQVLSREFGDSFLRRSEVPFRRTNIEKVRAFVKIWFPVLAAVGIRDFPSYLTRDMVREFFRHRTVQAVPSVIIPQELNYLIDPHSARADTLTWSRPQPFQFDVRLLDAQVR